MVRIKYDNALLKYMVVFESITHTKLKDVIDSDKLIFIVMNNISKAIGKKGINVRKLETKFGRSIKIVEFSENVVQFVKNFICPLRAHKISLENDIVMVEGGDTKTKALLIGRNSKNLTFLKEVVKRYYKIEDIKVI